MDDIDLDELNEYIKNELNKTYTVKEVIEERIKEEESIKESFNTLWNNYNTVKKVRDLSIYNLRNAKYKIILLNLFLLLFRNDVKSEIDKIINVINNANNELIDEKELLILIRDALKELQKHKAINANYEMSNLLSCLYDKNVAIYKSVCEDISNSTAIIKGFNIPSVNKYKDEIDDLNYEINESVKKLGLKNT